MDNPEQDFVAPPAISAHPAWARLEGQRAYYSRRAGEYQDRYKRIKLALIGVAAAIPILAFLPPQELTRYLVALAGVVIAVLEGVLLLNQYGTLWVKYRGTAEGLKRERWLLLSGAGDYSGMTDAEALRLLAERVETLIESEHREWTEQQKKALETLADTRAWVEAQGARQARAEAEGAPVSVPAVPEPVPLRDMPGDVPTGATPPR